MTIEPTRLPFLVLDALARRRFPALPEAVRAGADTILVDVPVVVSPLQDRLRAMVRAITEGYALMGKECTEHTLRLQDELGAFFWRLLDRFDPNLDRRPVRRGDEQRARTPGTRMSITEALRRSGPA